MFDSAPDTDAPREAREAWCKAMARRTVSNLDPHRLSPSYGHTGASVAGLMMRDGRPPLPLGYERVVELAGEALEEHRRLAGIGP